MIQRHEVRARIQQMIADADKEIARRLALLEPEKPQRTQGSGGTTKPKAKGEHAPEWPYPKDWGLIPTPADEHHAWSIDPLLIVPTHDPEPR